MTDREVQTALAIGHGASSGTLTRLHKSGRVQRLTRRRNGNQVYVQAEHVLGREVSPYRPNGGKADLQDRLDEARAIVDQWEPSNWSDVVDFRNRLLRVLGEGR